MPRKRTDKLNLLGGPAHVDSGGGSVGPLGDGEVDSDAAAVDLLVAHSVLSGLRVLHGFEVDEGKAARASRLKMAKDVIIQAPKFSFHN